MGSLAILSSSAYAEWVQGQRNQLDQHMVGCYRCAAALPSIADGSYMGQVCIMGRLLFERWLLALAQAPDALEAAV